MNYMAENKKSVLLYCDLIHTVEKMDDETAGLFFKHYLRYVNDLDPETDNLLVEITFESVKQNLKRDLKKWSETVEKRSLAGKASAKAREEKRKQNSTNPTRVKSVQQTSTNPTVIDTVNVTDNVNVNVKGIIPQTPEGDSIDWTKLLLFFNSTFNKKSRTISINIKKKYNARLKEGYTKEDIQTAMQNAAKDSFHKEQKYNHCTLEFFSRADKIDKFINAKEVKNEFKKDTIDNRPDYAKGTKQTYTDTW